MCDADETCPFVEKGFVGLLVEPCIGSKWDDTQLYTLAFGKQLPRNDVAVMLHGGDYHFVPLGKKCFAKGGGHQVDALGRATRKDNLVAVTGIDETAYRFARLLILLGSLLREEMYATMHIGIDIRVRLGNGIYYA